MQLEWRYEESISQQTMPITFLELLTATPADKGVPTAKSTNSNFTTSKRSILIPENAVAAANYRATIVSNLPVEAEGG